MKSTQRQLGTYMTRSIGKFCKNAAVDYIHNGLGEVKRLMGLENLL
jgi:hypothetical protein